MRALAAALAFGLAAAPAFAADSYVFEKNHARVYFAVGHLGFSTWNGAATDVDGKITLDTAKPEASSVEATIAVKGIRSGHEGLDAHLMKPDFFDAEKFPTITFKSTKVEPTGKDTAKVTGDLTLKGVTKPVTLDIKANKIGEHPRNKAAMAGFSGTVTIKRSDFGMTYGVPAIGDEIDLSLEIEALKK